jgi:LacI family transcriptional regulator
VGIATVSRVINGGVNVSKNTLEKILAVIKKYNYNPSSAARILSKRAFVKKLIGIVMPKTMNQFFFELIKAISRVLRDFDYNILIYNAEKGRRSVFEYIISEDLPGLFLFGDPPVEKHEKELLVKSSIPYIYLDHHGVGENFVAFDHYLGGRLAAKYLLKKNRKDMMFVGKSDALQQQNDRFRGFRDELADNGVDNVQEMYLPDLNLSYSVSRELFRQESINGIFYFSDIMAYGGLQAKNELNSDINIIAYDDIFPSKYTGLSTIRQSVDVLAEKGVNLLVKKIDERYEIDKADPVQIILDPELIDRNS